MPLVTFNAIEGQAESGARAVRRALAGLAQDAPVVVMIHGYRFSPATPQTDPHRHILGLQPAAAAPRALSWPRHMGFGRDARREGLCIAFGWEARGTLWRAWAEAGRAGEALARLIGEIAARHPGPVDLMAHSLGARVGLAAMARLPRGAIGRAILMAAAEYRSTAGTALASDAGRGAEVINVVSRENDLFDSLIEWTIARPARGDKVLGDGLGRARGNWLDLHMDCAVARTGLAGLGYRVPPPVRRVCHWSAYLRPGLFALYRDLIRQRDTLPLSKLRAALPDRPAPRWQALRPALPGLRPRATRRA